MGPGYKKNHILDPKLASFTYWTITCKELSCRLLRFALKEKVKIAASDLNVIKVLSSAKDSKWHDIGYHWLQQSLPPIYSFSKD